MLHRVGIASSFAITASLLSGIAAVASTTGPTGMNEAYKHAREQYCQGGGD